MDDERTQDTLDALADLFLTGTAGFESGSGGSETRPRRKAPNPLAGPEPIRLEPKAAPRYQAPPPLPVEEDDWLEQEDDTPVLRLRRDEDDFEALADAAMTDEAAEATDGSDTSGVPASPREAYVEAVFLGNLPGLSGPWLTQYAQLLAQQDGPVAILHVDDERIDAELIEPARPAADDPGGRVSSRMPPKPQRDADLITMLDALLTDAHQPVRTVLVHLEASPEEPWLSRGVALDCWTMLCGADDAAVVGAYRTLKQLTEADERVAGKSVGLMMMGSDRAASRAAAGKVRAAAESFLQTPIELVGWQQQMVPVNLRQVGSWEGTDTVWPVLATWLNELDEPVVEEVEKKPETRNPKIEVTEPAPAGVAEPAIEPESEPERDEAAALPIEPIAAEPGPQDPEPPAAPAPTPEPQAPAPDLASFLTTADGGIPGGIVLEARCPQQPLTQLLLDDAGRLHLLRRSEPSEAAGDDTALRAAILDLIEARRWVRDHLDLLRLTQRQCRFDAGADPVLHLFTDRADRATALVAQLGPMIKLHLLQSVAVGDQQTWFCTALS